MHKKQRRRTPTPTPSAAVAPPIEVTFHGLAAGGDAVARHAGLVIFAPFALPGERARIEVVEQRPTFARARVVEVLAPAAQRVAPVCPHFGQCGGCAWQHMQYGAQVQAKTEIVREQFARIAKVPDAPIRPCLPSPQPYSYRNSARLARTPAGEPGYRAAASHVIVPVRECPILERALQQELAVAPLAAGRAEFVLRVPMQPIAIGAESYFVAPGSFFQVNSAQAALLVELVLGALALQGHEALLDLYCGVGLFTLPMARRAAAVLGVEIEGSSMRDAERNLVPCANAELLHAPVEQALQDERITARRWDAIVLDPPRRGVERDALERIAALKASSIVYVSCDPATLARDVRLLLDHGYVLRSVQPVDMFPQTAHVECVVHLQRSTQSHP